MTVPTATLRQRVTVQPFLGATGSGRAWGEPSGLLPARIVSRLRTIRNRDGVDVVSTASITFRPDVELAAESKINHGADTYTVLDVTVPADLTRPHATVVLVEGPR